jgi:hypothetical protein
MSRDRGQSDSALIIAYSEERGCCAGPTEALGGLLTLNPVRRLPPRTRSVGGSFFLCVESGGVDRYRLDDRFGLIPCFWVSGVLVLTILG